MGYALLVLANALNGYYHLNINKKLDRWTALQLAKINAFERKYMIDQTLNTWGSGKFTLGLYVGTPKNPYGHGGTAQNLNWSNFRNESLGGQESSRQSGLTDDFFKSGLRDKNFGTLSFDYSSTSRIPMGSIVMTEYAIATLLFEAGVTKTMEMEEEIVETSPPTNDETKMNSKKSIRGGFRMKTGNGGSIMSKLRSAAHNVAQSVESSSGKNGKDK